MYGAPPRRVATSVSAEEEPVDIREIDKVLTEVAGMAGRWNLFRKFLFENMEVRHFIDFASRFLMTIVKGDLDPDQDAQQPPTGDVAKVEELPFQSAESFGIFENLLTEYYIPLELWYIRTIIDKVRTLSDTCSSRSFPPV